MKSLPKFAPKIPIKKEKLSNDSNPDLNQLISTSSIVSNEVKPSKIEPAERLRKKYPPGTSAPNAEQRRVDKRNPGRGSIAGRGYWVMPTGTTFFTSNTVVSTSLNIKASENKVTRPNEDIKTVYPNASLSQKEIKSEHTVVTGQSPYKSSSIKYEATLPSLDSDSDNDLISDQYNDSVETNLVNEVWPPEEVYDILTPLTLPLGPKTANLRSYFASEPILANPNDNEAMMKERQQSLFLIQLPSDLRFETVFERKDKANRGIHSMTDDSVDVVDADAVEDSDPIPSSKPSSGRPVPQSKHIGKMVLYKSGKVRLITNDGRSFEVSSGMVTSFAQYLAALTLQDASTATNTSSDGTEQNRITANTSEDANISNKPIKVENTYDTSSGPKVSSGSNSKGANVQFTLEDFGKASQRTMHSGSKNNVGKLKANQIQQDRPSDAIHFMGHFTKKIVMVPEYSVGSKNKKFIGKMDELKDIKMEVE